MEDSAVLDKKEQASAVSEQPKFEVNISNQFTAWMAEQNVSILLTTYQTGKFFLFGLNPKNELSVFDRTINRCMGMCANEQTVYVTSLYQVWRFENILLNTERYHHYDKLYVPQLAYTTGDLDIHDIQVTNEGKIVFANTLFNCLASPSITHSFKPYWKPPFISDLAPEDRCHLNGLALRDGLPRYVSMVAKTNERDGWRQHRNDGGIIMDITSNSVISEGLSMPHSPRWHDGKLWLLNSGKGEFGFVSLDSGKFEPISFCPGYARGMSIYKDFAAIGLSKRRGNTAFTGLALDENLENRKLSDNCGVMIVDLKKRDIVHSLQINGVVEEIYDVAIVPNVRCPAALGFRTDEIKHHFSIEN